MQFTEIQALCKNLGSGTCHKIYHIKEDDHKRLKQSGIFERDGVIPHDAFHVILLKVYDARDPTDAGKNIVEATFLSVGGKEIENNNPGFYEASTIRVWMSKKVTGSRSNKKCVFSKLEEAATHSYLQNEFTK